MKSGVMEDDAPEGQTIKWKVAWEQVSKMVNGCQVLEYLWMIVVPARDTRRDKYTRIKDEVDKQVKLAGPNYSSKQEFISARNKANYCRFNHSKHQRFIEK
jgi:hypothetical protein